MSRKIVVKRPVFDAAQELQKEAEAIGGEVFSLAEKKIDECQAAGDKRGVRFWREVWMYLTSAVFLEAAIEII